MESLAAGRVRTRFAPSPTGRLHLGNVHTALFAWLYARRQGGDFVLRFEDTDLEREVHGSEQAILKDLRWLGLDWDEGPDCGGPYGPYRQSDRSAYYAQAAEQLREAGLAYECFCTADELAERRAEALSRGEPPRYDGRCRDLSLAERRRKAEELKALGRRPGLRFRLPAEDREIVVDDVIYGPTRFHTRDLDDFLLVRPSGLPLYNFAVVVDDWTMAISHVIRGEEHLPNTPRQILLFEALGAAVPVFAHVPMLMGPGRRKLSKREQATTLEEYRDQGFLPEALLNYLALLGWSDPAGRELLSRQDLEESFALERVGRSAAVFDPERLGWMNREYLRRLAPDELWARLGPFLRLPEGVLADEGTSGRLRRVAAALREEAPTLAALGEAVLPYAPTPLGMEREAERLLSAEHVPGVVSRAASRLASLSGAEWRPEVLGEVLHQLPAELGLGVGKVFRPLRAVLTGRTSGPELPVMVSLLGRELTLERLDAYNRFKGDDRAE